MQLVSTVTVGAAGAANIDFLNVPQTGTDLMIVYSARANTTSQSYDVMRFNSGGTYNARTVEANGSTVLSRASAFTSSSYGPIGPNQRSTDTSSTFSSMAIYIPNYTGSQPKTWLSESVTENDSSTAFAWLVAADSNVTAAITSIRILPANTLVEGSIASLYIITKGTGGATVA